MLAGWSVTLEFHQREKSSPYVKKPKTTVFFCNYVFDTIFFPLLFCLYCKYSNFVHIVYMYTLSQ